MSWKLARKDMDLLIRNPITYLGIILMIWIVFYTVSPFWNLYGNVRDEKSSVVYDSDGEIEDGYIPNDVYCASFPEHYACHSCPAPVLFVFQYGNV